jgi:hypothetical protein
MNVGMIVRITVATAITIASFAGSAARAQEPSAAVLAMAKELVILKGGSAMFDPIIPGVIESAKNTFVPTNPDLTRELNEVAAQLRKDYDSKRAELLGEVVRLYALRFSAQELKDILAFYKTPAGRKMLNEEPMVIEESMRRAQNWANDFSEQVIVRFRTEMKKKGHDL